MAEGLICKISKFAADKKITGRVTSTAEKALLQADLDRLVNWSQNWQMGYNIVQLEVLLIGNNNNRTNSSINSTKVPKVNEEKKTKESLFVMIFKPGKRCSEVVKAANKLIRFGLVWQNLRIQIGKSGSQTIQYLRASTLRILRSVLVTLL